MGGRAAHDRVSCRPAGGECARRDADDFVKLRSIKLTSHVAQKTSGRRSAIDGRTTRHSGCAGSQRIRERIEAAFGWIKAGQRKTRFRGRDRVGWAFGFWAAAYNLVRLPKLTAQID